MGHQRPGQIPKTQKWTNVVEKVTSTIGASAEGAGKIDVVLGETGSSWIDFQKQFTMSLRQESLGKGDEM